MGTNYYLIENECPHCKRYERKHIGKSAMGWTFALRIYPEEGINTLDDWKPLLENGHIQDEYEKDVSFKKMMSVITDRRWVSDLLRSEVGCRHCTGHGEGTWDYFVGEFR